MKKLILAAALLFVAVLPLVALEGYETQTFHEQTDDKFVSIDLVYTETTRSLIVNYTLKYRGFDEGDAFVAVRDAIKKFADEHGYKSYAQYSEDTIKYHKNETVFTRFITLSE